MIKAYEEAKYANFVDIIDEMSYVTLPVIRLLISTGLKTNDKETLGIATTPGSSTSVELTLD